MNNDSLVMRMQYGKSSVLLEGDAEAPSEREMLAHGRVAAVTLLKVGHHGSRTSTTQEFLDALLRRMRWFRWEGGIHLGTPGMK